MNSCTMTPFRSKGEKTLFVQVCGCKLTYGKYGVWRPLYFRGIEAVTDYTALQDMGQSGGERLWCLKHNPH